MSWTGFVNPERTFPSSCLSFSVIIGMMATPKTRRPKPILVEQNRYLPVKNLFQNPSQGNKGASNVKEALVRFDQAFMTNQQSEKCPEPRERPLHDPTMPIAAKLPTVLFNSSSSPGSTEADCCRMHDQLPGDLGSGTADQASVLVAPGRWQASAQRVSLPLGTPSPGVLQVEHTRHRSEPSTLCPFFASSCRPWAPFLRARSFRR
jgi:hypothetical protein